MPTTVIHSDYRPFNGVTQGVLLHGQQHPSLFQQQHAPQNDQAAARPGIQGQGFSPQQGPGQDVEQDPGVHEEIHHGGMDVGAAPGQTHLPQKGRQGQFQDPPPFRSHRQGPMSQSHEQQAPRALYSWK